MKISKKNYRNLLYVTGFLFVSTSILSGMKVTGLLAYDDDIQETIISHKENSYNGLSNFTGPMLPIKNIDATFPDFTAYSILAIDVESGATLFEKNPEIQVLPASTTKIMTALIAMEAYDVGQILTVPNLKSTGQKMDLVPGEKISVMNLLYGLLVFSANDAAEVLAYYYPMGGREGFISRMNEKAVEVGMRNTVFVNPTGLEGQGHLSTAKDMVTLSTYAMRNDVFASIVGTKDITVKSNDEIYKHHLTSINELLGKVDGVLGVKTGWTENAKENLVSYVERDGRYVAIALLGSNDRFGESTKLIEWIYQNYSWEEVVEP